MASRAPAPLRSPPSSRPSRCRFSSPEDCPTPRRHARLGGADEEAATSHDELVSTVMSVITPANPAVKNRLIIMRSSWRERPKQEVVMLVELLQPAVIAEAVMKGS